MVLAAALLWGSTGTAQSFAPPQLSSFWVGALRLAVAGLFFAAWLLATERRALAPLALAALPWRPIAAAALCMAVYNLAFFAGVRASGVAVGTAIALGSAPVWAGLLQWWRKGRAPAPAWWGGTALAVTGGALMVLMPAAGGTGGKALTANGVTLCLLTGLSYAIYAQINQHLVVGASAAAVTGAAFVLAALVALPLAWALAGPPVLVRRDLLIVGWLGVMSTGVAYLLLSHALRRIGSATAVALSLGEPVTAFVLALVVVGERPSPAAFAGLGAVLLGLALVVRAELRAAVSGSR